MSSDQDQTNHRNDRLLTTLEQLLAIEATELKSALDQASQLVADVLGADKVDVFLYEAASESLVAMGTSATPMGRRQHQIGLNRQQLANGGSAAMVFQSGRPQLTGQADQDPDELKGVTEILGVHSALTCALQVSGERRGVLQAVSAAADAYTDHDQRFLEAVARWIGMVTHRTELFEQTKHDVADQSRRAAVDELISLLPHASAKSRPYLPVGSPTPRSPSACSSARGPLPITSSTSWTDSERSGEPRSPPGSRKQDSCNRHQTGSRRHNAARRSGPQP